MDKKEEKFLDDMATIFSMLGVRTIKNAAFDFEKERFVRTDAKFTTDEFCMQAEATLLDIEELFKKKNRQYSDDNDVLSAFINGAVRRYNNADKASILKVIFDYKDKHDLALLEHGAELEDADDRLNDIIVYCIFAKLVLNHVV